MAIDAHLTRWLLTQLQTAPLVDDAPAPPPAPIKKTRRLATTPRTT